MAWMECGTEGPHESAPPVTKKTSDRACESGVAADTSYDGVFHMTVSSRSDGESHTHAAAVAVVVHTRARVCVGKKTDRSACAPVSRGAAFARLVCSRE